MGKGRGPEDSDDDAAFEEAQPETDDEYAVDEAELSESDDEAANDDPLSPTKIKQAKMEKARIRELKKQQKAELEKMREQQNAAIAKVCARSDPRVGFFRGRDGEIGVAIAIAARVFCLLALSRLFLRRTIERPRARRP